MNSIFGSWSLIAHKLNSLLIWRPDTPSRSELESLQKFLLTDPLADADEVPLLKNDEAIREIFKDLYVTRGQLIGISGQQIISNEIGSHSVCQYISMQLSAAASTYDHKAARGTRRPSNIDDQNQALQWAALLTGRPDLENSDVEYARQQMIEWWMNSVEGLSRRLTDLPEAFRTTRFGNEIKFVENHALALKPILYNLRGGASSFQDTIEHLGRHFAWDRGRVLKWKQSLDSLAGLILWLPAFQHAHEYLHAAFPLGHERVDHLRSLLLAAMQNPLSFLNAQARKEFDEKFLEFKKNYIDCYYALHEDALHVTGTSRKNDPKIDPVALRNLDLLSKLHYTDKSYLNRVKLIARWMQRNQCALPLRDILERYPRCYCNFNPCFNQQTAVSVSQINAIIQDGIDYFRSVLRKCRHLILEELSDKPAQEESSIQINALLSDGPMIPLKPDTVTLLNAIILKHPNQFLAEIRKIRKTDTRTG